ncbi:VCBS repeat-containing protein [Arthrobacter sp. OVS8]|nr:VCBS repeat-containing protein [Arthrobacter sp. OVS8]
MLARESSTGRLWLYRGNGFGGWLPRILIGSGWQAMSAIVGPGDFNGDQRVDVLAREAATGIMWLYPGTGTGGWQPRVRVGSGWNAFNALVAPGILTATERPTCWHGKRPTAGCGCTAEPAPAAGCPACCSAPAGMP